MKQIVFKIEAEVSFNMDDQIEIAKILDHLRAYGKADIVDVRIEEEKKKWMSLPKMGLQ
jgi:hypothetical protein